MTPEDANDRRRESRPARRYGHLFFVAMILMLITIVAWLKSQFLAP
jgi:hypothetical protein